MPRILLGRILAWQKDYEQAAAVIDTLLKTEPDNADALSARRDISLWSKETQLSQLICALAIHSIISLNHTHGSGRFLLSGQVTNSTGVPLSADVNIGNLITDAETNLEATEVQFEARGISRLSQKRIMPTSIMPTVRDTYFPTHRAAVEIWQVLPAGFAVSAGLNYYYFDRNIFIALASVEKYLGKYWLSGKVYVYFKDDGPTTSFYLNVRSYFNDFNYLQLTLGTGTAPDEPFDIQSDINAAQCAKCKTYI